MKDSVLLPVLLRHKRTLNPYAYHLAKVDWSVFGTLTWEQDIFCDYTLDAELLRRGDFYWLICVACKKLKLRQRRLAIYRRTEFSQGMRGHCNFLIAKRGAEKVTSRELAHTLTRIWTQESWKGLAVIQPFDIERHLNGITYQSKREFDSFGNELWLFEEFTPALKRLFQNNAGCNIYQ